MNRGEHEPSFEELVPIEQMSKEQLMEHAEALEIQVSAIASKVELFIDYQTKAGRTIDVAVQRLFRACTLCAYQCHNLQESGGWRDQFIVRLTNLNATVKECQDKFELLSKRYRFDQWSF